MRVSKSWFHNQQNKFLISYWKSIGKDDSLNISSFDKTLDWNMSLPLKKVYLTPKEKSLYSGSILISNFSAVIVGLASIFNKKCTSY